MDLAERLAWKTWETVNPFDEWCSPANGIAKKRHHEMVEVIVREALEEAEQAIRMCNSLDENGYIIEKSEGIKALRALT